MSNIELLETLLASIRPDKFPTLIDAAVAVRVAYSDDRKVSDDERRFILRHFTGKLAPVINLTKQPIRYFRYVESVATARRQKANHINAFLKKLMRDCTSNDDAEKILKVLKYNKEFLPQAMTLSGDISLFKTPELQRKVDEGLFKLRNESIGHAHPYTPRVGTSTVYHGIGVPTPYSWLATNSDETKKWIETQTQFTQDVLAKIPFMKELLDYLKYRSTYPRIGPPAIMGNHLYYSRRNPGQDKFVYVRKPLAGGEEEVVIDPNKFKKGEVLRKVQISPDNRYAVVVIGNGSDWEEFYLMDMVTKKIKRDTEIDHIKWTASASNSKNMSIVWDKDNKGFYYARYDEPPKGEELTAKTKRRRICYHKLGTKQNEDQPVYFDTTKPDSRPNFTSTPDGRFSFVTISEDNKGLDGNALLFRDNTKVGASPTSPFTPIIAQAGNFKYTPIGHVDGKLLVLTNDGAPNNRLVLIDPANPTDKTKWKNVLPQQKDSPLESVKLVKGKLFATRMQNGSSHIVVYDSTGRFIKELDSPKIGTAEFVAPLQGVTTAFYTTQSFNQPPIIYKVDLETLRTEVFQTTSVPGFSADKYELKQIHFHIVRDGKKIPASMFIMHKKGIKLDGNNPVYAAGYGGFNTPQLPYFSAMTTALMDQGVVRVWVNLPGDGGHGEEWHQNGMKTNKQNVFDAFIASLKLLIKNRYTNSSKIAIEGGSNGGLLVAAVMNQCPNLVKVVIPDIPLADVLNFERSSSGREWAAELGSPSSDRAAFNNIIRYSPLHNVGRRGSRYPAVIITTGINDQRVPPGMNALPLAAELQRKTTSGNPVLIRIDGAAGHGAATFSGSLQETRDIFAFMLYHLGVTPRFESK